MKKTVIIYILIIFVIFSAFIIYSQAASDNFWKSNLIQIDLPNKKSVRVKLAETIEEHQRGLSNIKDMQGFDGMLFRFKEAQQVSFWMNEMFFPLDIIYLNGNKEIAEIHEDMTPCLSTEVCQPIPSLKNNINYVLELDAGEARLNNLKINQKLVW